MAGKSFWSHPELKEGEVYLGNFSVEDFAGVTWKTKRSGFVAYDVNGQPSPWPGLFPGFAQRSELEEAGIDPDTLWVDGKVAPGAR